MAIARPTLRVIALLCLIAFVSGCTLVQLRKEAASFYASTVIVGRVTAPSESSSVIVAAIDIDEHEQRISHHAWLHEPGGYELIVPSGRYRIVAFADDNGIGMLDHHEPAAISSTMTVTDERLIPLVDLQIASDSSIEARRVLSGRHFDRSHSTQVGALANLDRPEFSADAGRAAYWSPMESFRRAGGNVYFVEPFDPTRTPVLFVHGALGSAQDFQTFYRMLDRTRYQAWIFQYPSGAALESMSNLLYWKLLNLRARYRVERLHVVAHSMGGLVTRRFLLDHGHEFGEIDQFVTISTPWHGASSATLGVEHSPAVVPSWRDMQPDGTFLTDLFARPLPSHVTHTLLFGHRGGYSFVSPTSDGTVTLASQLRPQAQSAARLVMGFDEDHVSVLSARDVIDQVMRTLAPRSEQPQDRAGRLVVALNSGEADLTERFALLLLRRTDLEERSGSITLSIAAKNEQELAAIAPGTYEAHIAVPGYQSSPVAQHITVSADGVATLRAELRPQGVLTGRVVMRGATFDRPAGSYGRGATVSRIVLEGANGTRELLRESATSSLLDAYLEQRDALSANTFAFVGLSEGEYVLTVTLENGASHTSRHRIIPGQVAAEMPIVIDVDQTAPTK